MRSSPAPGLDNIKAHADIQLEFKILKLFLFFFLERVEMTND